MSQFDQTHFDSLLPRKPFLRAKEVGKLLGLSDSTIEKLIDLGQLDCHEYNGGHGLRMTRRIPRQSVVLLLLKSKDFAVEDYLSGIMWLLSQLSFVELSSINAQLPRLLEKAQRTLHDQNP